MLREHGYMVKVYDRIAAESAMGRHLTEREWDTLRKSPEWMLMGLVSQRDRDQVACIALDVLDNAGIELVTNG